MNTWDVDKKIPDTIASVTTAVLNTKTTKVKSKIPDTSTLVTTTVLKTKINVVYNSVI